MTITNTPGSSGVGTGLGAIDGTIEATGVTISKTVARTGGGHGIIADTAGVAGARSLCTRGWT